MVYQDQNQNTGQASSLGGFILQYYNMKLQDRDMAFRERAEQHNNEIAQRQVSVQEDTLAAQKARDELSRKYSNLVMANKDAEIKQRYYQTITDDIVDQFKDVDPKYKSDISAIMRSINEGNQDQYSSTVQALYKKMGLIDKPIPTFIPYVSDLNKIHAYLTGSDQELPKNLFNNTVKLIDFKVDSLLEELSKMQQPQSQPVVQKQSLQQPIQNTIITPGRKYNVETFIKTDQYPIRGKKNTGNVYLNY